MLHWENKRISMPRELSKHYDAKATEQRANARWEADQFANPDKLPARHTEPFVIMLPPPNVTGSLHMGHALEDTVTDTLVRMKRMQGYKVLWLPGTDHAGIATQRVVEKKIKKEQNKTRWDLGREKFLEEVWAWKEEYGDRIYQQLKRIGASLDYSRARFTMDEGCVKAVETAFHHYKDKGWIYKGTRVINWCYRCGTSLSDLELEYVEAKDYLYQIVYPFADPSAGSPRLRSGQAGQAGITAATTRPETMFGDTAVAVHPDDDRWKDIVGQKVTLPLTDRSIPIIADDTIDLEFGTGALKVTPAHDFADAEIGERHQLEAPQVITDRGKMADNEFVPEALRGKNIAEARETTVRELEASGALIGTEPLTHNVATCYRCGTVVEPIPSEQWCLKMGELAKMAAAAYESDGVSVEPERWKRVALDRLANERDWCISRQLWWGHKIPVDGEEDVLDTWFSSALWPFATLGWPDSVETSSGKPAKGSDLDLYYPGHWMTSDRGILFLWQNQMVFSGLEFMGKLPFTKLYIHPTVLTKSGQRMSKSLGTGIDPLELIDQHGADAVRFGLLWQATGVQDIRFDESAILAGKKFTNKIWNATRYALGTVGEEAVVPSERPKGETEEDQVILTALERATTTVTEEIEQLRYGQALETFYEFFWHQFCDVYLEQTKVRSDEMAKQVLLWVLSVSLRTLHPFMPFLTDELWEQLPHEEQNKIALPIAPWPEVNEQDNAGV